MYLIMINLIYWNKSSYQVVLEGTSFYYSKKLPVAFRLPRAPEIIIRDEQFGKVTQNFIDELKLLSRVVKKPVGEFKQLLSTAYKKAIFTGAKRIAMERMHGEEKEQNVTDRKNDGRLS
jgi:hypothetical protein